MRADGGQILVFSVFLLFFVMLLVVGQSLVLFARAREAERRWVEVFSRDVVDSATGFVNSIAASAYDLDGELFDAGGDVKTDYGKWRRVDGGWCDDDGNGTPDDGLGDGIVDEGAGVGCWRIVKGAEDTGNTGLAGKNIEFVRVDVEVRAGCTPGVDSLDATTGTLRGCATGDWLELRYKRRSMFDYVLHYHDNGLPDRWGAGASITNVVFDATGTAPADRDVIEGPIHTNQDHVLVCGTSASDVFTDTLVEVGAGSGAYKDDCGGGSSYGSLSNTGQITVEGLVVDEGEDNDPECDGSSVNTDWLRDARRPAEAGVVGYEHIVGDGVVDLDEFSAFGTRALTNVVYATGDLTVTRGTVNRPVTLIAEGDIIIEGSGQELGDSPIEFTATGSDVDGRTHVLGFLAGCDIIIDYAMNELPSPVPTDHPLRPEEPYRRIRPLYPENHWGKAHHAHYHIKKETQSWGSTATWCTYDFTNPITPTCASNESYTFREFPCYKSGSIPPIEGTCNARGYPGETFRHTWWRGADHPTDAEQGITKSEFVIVKDEYDKYRTAQGVYSAALDAFDRTVGQYGRLLAAYDAVDDHCFDGDPDNGEGPGCSSGAYAGCGCTSPNPADYDVSAYTDYQGGYNSAMSAYKNSIRPSFTSSNTPQTWTGRRIDHTDVDLSGCTSVTSCTFSLPSVPLPPAPNQTKPFAINYSHPCNTPPIEVTNAYFETGYDVWHVYNWHDPTVRIYQADCDIDGIEWDVAVSENHAEYWVWIDWYPTAPTWPAGPHAAPASYPNGNPQRGGSTADDGYCVSWDEWVYRDEVLTWNPLTPDTGNVPSATKSLSGGWASGSPLTPIENHTILDKTNHGPDRPYKGGFHPDYKAGTNNLDEPPTLVTRVFDSSTEHLGHAVEHWAPNDYIMKNPTPKHELCDFMSFKLTNVALLAPAGGVVADKWYLPHQAGTTTTPTIEITGSISTRYRGLFGRANNTGDLISGYRKIFKYPDASTEFSKGTTAWWPDIKLDHWTPQP